VPYDLPTDLPPSVRDHIADDHGRRLFMHIFNTVPGNAGPGWTRSAKPGVRSNTPVGAKGRTASGRAVPKR
jgi:hypothetical protein